jgi:uncharacterized membrane protein
METTMTTIFITLSNWLHALATVIFIGYFVLLTAIFLPALADNPAALSKISKRSRPWLYAALLIFIVTGTYLMMLDTEYLGFMNLGNLWGIVMLVKHILVIGMIAMGFWFNAILRVGPLMSSNTGAEMALARFRRYVNVMAISGVLVLLLTSFAQAQ